MHPYCTCAWGKRIGHLASLRGKHVDTLVLTRVMKEVKKHHSCDNETATRRHATQNATKIALGNTRNMIHVEGEQRRG